MCSIFGTNISNVVLLTGLGVAGEVRGTDATGVSVLEEGNLTTIKSARKASEFNFSQLPYGENIDFYLGHTRATTKGAAHKNQNNHPFPASDGSFVLAHNGVIRNDLSLKEEWSLGDKGIKTDSYVIVQMLELTKFMYQEDDLNIEIVQEVCELIAGSFTLTIMTRPGKLFLLRHTNPLHIAYNGKELIYASTQEMIDKAVMFAEEYDTTKMLGTFIGEIENDTIYEYDLKTNQFVDRREFTAEVYTKHKSKNNKVGFDTDWDDEYYNWDYKNGTWTKKGQKKTSSATNTNDFISNTDKGSDIVIDVDEYYSLNPQERREYELCDECGQYFYWGFGGYNADAGQSLCENCNEDFQLTNSATGYNKEGEEEFLTAEEIAEMYPEEFTNIRGAIERDDEKDK